MITEKYDERSLRARGGRQAHKVWSFGSHGLVVNTRSSLWLTWLLVRLTWLLVHFSQKCHAFTEKSVVLELIKGKLKKIAMRVPPYA